MLGIGREGNRIKKNLVWGLRTFESATARGNATSHKDEGPGKRGGEGRDGKPRSTLVLGQKFYEEKKLVSVAVIDKWEGLRCLPNTGRATAQSVGLRGTSRSHVTLFNCANHDERPTRVSRRRFQPGGGDMQGKNSVHYWGQRKRDDQHHVQTATFRKGGTLTVSKGNWRHGKGEAETRVVIAKQRNLSVLTAF